jgi:hypothetical protein
MRKLNIGQNMQELIIKRIINDSKVMRSKYWQHSQVILLLISVIMFYEWTINPWFILWDDIYRFKVYNVNKYRWGLSILIICSYFYCWGTCILKSDLRICHFLWRFDYSNWNYNLLYIDNLFSTNWQPFNKLFRPRTRVI